MTYSEAPFLLNIYTNSNSYSLVHSSRIELMFEKKWRVSSWFSRIFMSSTVTI